MQCLHGDLTCRNILLNEDHTVAKVGDLGLSKMLQSTISELPMGGTLAFAAPEVLLNLRCNEKVLPSHMALAHSSLLRCIHLHVSCQFFLCPALFSRYAGQLAAVQKHSLASFPQQHVAWER